MITIVKVVSRNFIMDFAAKIQNIFGKNLTMYESMIQRGIDQCEKELVTKDIHLQWYRFEITQLTNGAVAIMLYGEEQ